MFLPNTNVSSYGKGSRSDGVDLISNWVLQRNLETFNSTGNASYVRNLLEMALLDPAKTDYVLGLFNTDHMSYELEREKTVNKTNREPSLREMTEKAIDILSRRDEGFFLAIEGGRVDHAHHAGKAKMAMHEVVAFDEAI